jgi:hypothetical protein
MNKRQYIARRCFQARAAFIMTEAEALKCADNECAPPLGFASVESTLDFWEGLQMGEDLSFATPVRPLPR